MSEQTELEKERAAYIQGASMFADLTRITVEEIERAARKAFPDLPADPGQERGELEEAQIRLGRYVSEGWKGAIWNNEEGMSDDIAAILSHIEVVEQASKAGLDRLRQLKADQESHYGEHAVLAAARMRDSKDEALMTEGVIAGLTYAIEALSPSLNSHSPKR